ncbi:restriction endonuclease subunit S [Larsenimonas suaedae]|uniref:Restriction endonuclease subunit S n=1 Tax=Larsenimonas suaedae TaxID=1851019 RepID=A0ABU1GY76_9GAMM|nr:restriction endonuclease subunit S [Larsenimonas suaedae]MCM2972901.1 restriction endonuclease subunit S [Larsenimonas suaedae]MDR5897000.1 restriction endonuclease subunit S [Larsenimonas suaedae]
MSCDPNWHEVPLYDVCESIMDCVNKTAPSVDYATPYKMIRTTNVRDGWVSLDQVKFVDKETYDKWIRRQKPQKGDVILTREAPLGEVGMLRSDERVFLGQRLVSYRANPEKLDNRFLLYAFQGYHLQTQIKALGSGSTVEHMRVPDAKKLRISLPTLSTQRQIASILSAYDDLIENNTRRIEILEEMARRLYEEWFIYFRFPGHEGMSFKESELGKIPEGWEVRRLDEVVTLNPKTKVLKEGEKWFVPMGALSESGMAVGPLEKKTGNSGAKFQNGDTLVARITPCLENGKTGFVDFLPEEQATACGSTEFIVMRSVRLCPEMTYLLARSDRFRDVAIKSMSGATGRQRVRVESLIELPVVQPDDATLNAFQNFVAPCFKQIRKLSKKNTNLRAQRDLLLPKLVSGETDVSDITMPDRKEVEAA